MPEFFEDKNRSKIDWSKIKKFREEGSLAGLSLALIESHRLLNRLLTESGYRGNNVREKITAARKQLTNLKELLEAIEIWESLVFSKDAAPKSRKIRQAISAYEKAIYDLSSETDYSPPGLLRKIWSWLEVNLVYKPVNRYRLIVYLLFFLLLVFVLDTTHFGQQAVSSLTDYISSVFVWFLVVAILLVLLLVGFSNLVNYFEERNK